MTDLNTIVKVDISRETQIPTRGEFGIGMILAEFKANKVISTIIDGRYLIYSTLSEMAEDGWNTSDRVYTAASNYFSQSPNPGQIVIGRKDETDANWTDALNAVQNAYAGWYGFTIITSNMDAVKEAAAWAETQVKLFGYTSGQLPMIGKAQLAKSGRYVSGKPGLVSTFATVSTGSLGISLNGGTIVDLTGIDFTAKPATSGKLTTIGLSSNLANIIAVDNGEMVINVDGTDFTLSSLDFTAATTIANVATVINTALTTATAGADCVASGSRLIFESDTTGATSSVTISAVDGGSGTDITGTSYLSISGATVEAGTASGGAVSSYEDIALVLEEEIQAGDVSLANVTVEWDGVCFVFRSPSIGATSKIELSSGTAGVDLFKAAYIAEGFVLPGTDAIAVGGDILTFLKDKAYDNTVICYSTLAQDQDVAVNAMNFMWMAMCGEAFPYNAGSQTWAFKGLTGITPMRLSSGELTYLQNNNGNVYVTIAGVNQTMGGANGGKVVGGEYIDIIRGTAWLQSEIQFSVYGQLLANRKVPFTDAGGVVIELAILNPLRVAASTDYNLLDPEQPIIVNVPKVADISAADKAARTLRNVTFSAVYAGAIQKVEIQGSLSI